MLVVMLFTVCAIAALPQMKGVTTGAVSRHGLRHAECMSLKDLSTRSAMWIPGPLYESLPYLYVLGGILFLGGTLYIGTSAPGFAVYAVCGLISIAYGAYIFKVRHDARQRQDDTAYIKSLSSTDSRTFP